MLVASRGALSVGALGTPPVILGSEIVAARIGKPSVLALFLPSSKSSKKYIKIINIITIFLGGEMTCRLVILRLGKQSQLVITLTSNPIYVISIFIYVFNCISILISSGPRILPNQKDVISQHFWRRLQCLASSLEFPLEHFLAARTSLEQSTVTIVTITKMSSIIQSDKPS